MLPSKQIYIKILKVLRNVLLVTDVSRKLIGFTEPKTTHIAGSFCKSFKLKWRHLLLGYHLNYSLAELVRVIILLNIAVKPKNVSGKTKHFISYRNNALSVDKVYWGLCYKEDKY